MSKMTIKTLANLLGLSIATVSKALKDSYEISTETKKKVQELAANLNYVPNPYASSLRKQKSKTIAVILPEVADSFFSLAINGIQEIASARNYHVLIYLSHESFDLEKQALNHCSSGRADGVLLSVANETKEASHLEKLSKEDIPIVFFDRALDNYPAPKVITNDFDCGVRAATLLLEKGCLHPVILSTSEGLSICNKRTAGFVAGLAAAGYSTTDREFIIDCNGPDSYITDQIKQLIRSKPIDGIVASVEKLATQTYLACLEDQKHIPADLKVIAFSTLETAAILNPALTTISQPAFNIGRNAAEILFGLIDKKKHAATADYTLVLPSELIERTSTS